MRLFRFFIITVLFNLFVVAIYADDYNPLVYQYTDPDITVEFTEPLDVSIEHQREIADKIAGFTSATSSSPNTTPVNNIICTLFGHDIAPEVSVTATHHKVNKYNPRCLMELYHVTYCKRCDYTVEELVNDFFIFCCPED